MVAWKVRILPIHLKDYWGNPEDPGFVSQIVNGVVTVGRFLRAFYHRNVPEPNGVPNYGSNLKSGYIGQIHKTYNSAERYYFAATGEYMTWFFPAGNDNTNKRYYPPAYSPIWQPLDFIGVGAYDISGSRYFASETVASNYGVNAKLWAPGVNITVLTFQIPFPLPPAFWGTQVETLSGTSASAPFAAALGALYYEKHPALISGHRRREIWNNSVRYTIPNDPDPGVDRLINYYQAIIDTDHQDIYGPWPPELPSQHELWCESYRRQMGWDQPDPDP